MQEPILESNFFVNSAPTKVSLFSDKLVCTQTVACISRHLKNVLYLDDVIGCRLEPITQDCDPTKVSRLGKHRLRIFAMPYKKLGTKKKTRVEKELVLLCTNKEETGLEVWNLALKNLLAGVQLSARDIDGIAQLPLPPIRKFLLFLNPKSGKCLGKTVVRRCLNGPLQQAGIDVQIMETERPFHAQEIAQSLDLAQYDVLACGSGDGVIHELINGLMKRPDHASAIKTPIAVLPMGTGNAFCCSLAYNRGEKSSTNHLLRNMIVRLIKGKPGPVDLVEMETATDRFYSFLSLTIGIVAEIDVGSEKYRAMGDARYTLAALAKVFKPTYTSLKISVLLAEENELPSSITKNTHNAFTSRCCTADKAKSSTFMMNESSANQIGSVTERNNCKNEHEAVDGAQIVPNKRSPRVVSVLEKTDSCVNMPLTLPSKPQSMVGCTAATHLPKLDDDLPLNWITLDSSEFSFFHTMLMSHAASDFIVAKETKMDDGLLAMITYPGQASRISLISSLVGFEDGSYMFRPELHVRYIKAFRIDPGDSCPLSAVDGEPVTMTKLQGRVLPRHATFIL